jgi:HPt (histidine-containing phosphotransfer) domain-containing protein
MGKIEIDWMRLADLDNGTGEGDRIVRELIRLFKESCESGVAQVREAVASGNKILLSKSLHKLGGSCGTLGAVSVNRAINEWERLLETGSEGSPGAGLSRIEALIALTSIEFNRKYPETIEGA